MEVLPIVGEVTTAIKSAAKVISAGVIAPFDSEKADQLVKGAGEDWVNYSERNIIAGPINAGVRKLAGDDKGAARVIGDVGDGLAGVADGLPVVGHVKGVVHYAMGDTEKGHQSMISASRTTAVLGAGLVTGGVGGGILVGGMAGVGSGVVYDGAHSVIDSAVKDERSTHGIWDIDRKLVESHKKNDLNEAANAEIDAVGSLVFDFMAGSSATEAGKSLRKANKIKSQQVAVKDAVGKELYDPVKNAAREMKGYSEEGVFRNKGNGYVETVVSDEGKVSKGYNQQARRDINVHQFEKVGDESGFKSKNNAKKSAVANDSYLTKTQPDVEPVLQRKPTTCAEHDAITRAASRNSNLNVAQLKICSMRIYDGVVSLVERCGNCKAFRMGRVVSDLRKGVRVPLESIRPYLCKACFAGAAALVSEAAFHENK